MQTSKDRRASALALAIAARKTVGTTFLTLVGNGLCGWFRGTSSGGGSAAGCARDLPHVAAGCACGPGPPSVHASTEHAQQPH